jgi:PAS domain S-box-containing protein
VASPVASGPAPRIVVVGGTPEERAQVAAALGDVPGWAIEIGRIEEVHPANVTVLLAPVGEAAALVASRRRGGATGDALVVLIGAGVGSAEIAQVLAAGADDCLVAPAPPELIVMRVANWVRAAELLREQRLALRCQETLLTISDLCTREAGWNGVRQIVHAASALLGYERGSLLVGHDERVWLLRDEASGANRPIPVVLPAFAQAAAAIAAQSPSLPSAASSDAVFPLPSLGRTYGALMFANGPDPLDRSQPPQPPGEWRRLAQHEVHFGKLVAARLAAFIAQGPLRRMFRGQTTPMATIPGVSSDDFTPPPTPLSITQFQAYFEAASDGIVVADASGRVLFVNRAAEALTGFARETLVSRSLGDLVAPGDQDPLTGVIAHVLSGRNLDSFDLRLVNASGDVLWVSFATSTVMAEHGAAIFSLRDVTAERVLEAELRKTKEFLERLIDSTVDAIVAAGPAEKIILYNAGAERLFGWPAEEAIARLSLDHLYPDGVAKQIMRMIRSPSHGGVGRLELTRREVTTAAGELVPVNMTASIVYEGDREVATVAILSDLRERIRIEQRLLQAQEKLVDAEKQALVAELAGTAAHELNQPLTSVLLSAEQMQKKMAPDDPFARTVGIIVGEAARMAEIVKKIGQITRYETKQYVGSQAILDLEKASGADRGEKS